MSNRQELPSCAAVAVPSIGTWAGFLLMCLGTVSYTHLTLPTIYSV